MTYRLVLFDFDGTLADTFPLFVQLLHPIAARFGFRAPEAHELDHLRGLSTAAVLAACGVPRWKLPAIMRHAQALMAADVGRITLFDGVAPLLHTLTQQQVQLAVVSSNREDTVRAVLGESLCASISAFSCGVGLFGKSAKIRRVLARTRVLREHAAFVGDEQRDVAAARRAGVTAVAVTWGYASEQALSQAHVRCRSVAELAQALDGTPSCAPAAFDREGRRS